MSLSYKLHAIMYVSDYTFTYFCIGGSYKKQLTKNGEHVYTLGASDHIMDEVEAMGRDFYDALALTHQDINEKEVKELKKPKQKTNFELWLDACKQNNTQVIPIDQKETWSGSKIVLYKTVREIEPTAATNWNRSYETAYILWTRERHFENVRDLITGLQILNYRMRHEDLV